MKIYLTIITSFLTLFLFAQENNKTIWSLEDCINYALKNNINVKDVSLDKTQATIDYKASKSLRLPNLFGTASQSFSNGNSIDPITSNYVTDQIHSTNIGINSSMTLYQGNQLKNRIAQNELLLNQSEFLIEETKNNISLSILENYLQILHAKEGIQIAENNLNSSEQEVERARARLDAGNIALSDYTEALSLAATNKYALINAKNNYQQYLITLKQLLELDPTQDLEIKELDPNEDFSITVYDKIDIYSKALGILPEMNASELEIEIKEKDLSIAKGGYYPTLSLSGSVGTGYTSIANSDFLDQFNVNFNQRLGLSLSVPIFNQNKTKNAVKTAQVGIEKAKLSQKSTEKEIYLKVETAYQNAISAQEQLIAAKSSMEAAAQSYALAQKKYELGALSTTDLVLSQNTYTNAQKDYIQSKYLSILYHQLLQFYQGNDLSL